MLHVFVGYVQQYSAFEDIQKCDGKYPRFRASAAVETSSSLFSDVARPSLIVIYGRFGTTYGSHLLGMLDACRWDL